MYETTESAQRKTLCFEKELVNLCGLVFYNINFLGGEQ